MALFDLGSFRAHHVSLVSMIIGFLAGYDSGVAGGILSFTSFQKSFGYSENEKTTVQSLTVSLQVLGCFLSCFAAGLIVEKYGRRKSILAFAVVFIIGVILQVSPTDNLGAWYFARVFAGLGQGSLSIAV
jgi:MFS family permease